MIGAISRIDVGPMTQAQLTGWRCNFVCCFSSPRITITKIRKKIETIIQRQQVRASEQTLRRVRQDDDVAQGVGKELGGREVL
jgi:hypothetical protein